MLAHSLRLVLPSTTMPASRRRRTSAASCAGGVPTRAREPAVVDRPAVSTLSLISTGRPCSGERTCPAARARSAASASASACGFSALTERSSGSISVIRSSNRWVSSWAGPGVTARSWQAGQDAETTAHYGYAGLHQLVELSPRVVRTSQQLTPAPCVAARKPFGSRLSARHRTDSAFLDLLRFPRR